MALTLADIDCLARSEPLRGRVRANIAQTAPVVLAESGATTGHALRVTLAQQAGVDIDGVVTRFMPLVAANVNFANATPSGNDVTDAAINATVAALWDTVAGVST